MTLVCDDINKHLKCLIIECRASFERESLI